MTGSNRLPVLAAEIRKAHADVQDAAKTAAERAIEAGHALIEAKALCKHGQWLPWLREHCALAERTAQLYTKLAKSGATPETIAAFGMQGAASTLETIHTPDYKPFVHCTEQGKRDFHIFMLFLCRECGWYPEGAWQHVEYLSQKQFLSPDDWLTGKGAAWRKQWNFSEQSNEFLANWCAFRDGNRDLTPDDCEAALNEIHKRIGPMPAWQPPKKRRKRKSATVADLGARP